MKWWENKYRQESKNEYQKLLREKLISSQIGENEIVECERKCKNKMLKAKQVCRRGATRSMPEKHCKGIFRC